MTNSRISKDERSSTAYSRLGSSMFLFRRRLRTCLIWAFLPLLFGLGQATAEKGIRVGIITEHRGAHLGPYFGSLARCTGVEKVAIADPSGESFSRAKELMGKRFPEIATFADYRTMLDKFDPEMVLVSLEPHHSPEPIETALARGSHVLSEKPACVRLEDFERMAALAKSKDRRLMLVLANRNSPLVQKAKELIRSGYLGKLYGSQVYLLADQTRLTRPEYQRSWRASKARAGGGHLLWLGIHYLDLIQYMSGQSVRQVAGFYGNVGGQPIDVEDAAVVALQFDQGMVGTLQSGYYLDRGYQTGFKVWGSKGWLRFELDPNAPPLQWYSSADGAPEGVQTFEDTTGFMSDGTSQYFPFVQAAVDASRGVAPAPLTAAEGLQVLKVIFGAYDAADTGRTQTIE